MTENRTSWLEFIKNDERHMHKTERDRLKLAGSAHFIERRFIECRYFELFVFLLLPIAEWFRVPQSTGQYIKGDIFIVDQSDLKSAIDLFVAELTKFYSWQQRTFHSRLRKQLRRYINES